MVTNLRVFKTLTVTMNTFQPQNSYTFFHYYHCYHHYIIVIIIILETNIEKTLYSLRNTEEFAEFHSEIIVYRVSEDKQAFGNSTRHFSAALILQSSRP